MNSKFDWKTEIWSWNDCIKWPKMDNLACYVDLLVEFFCGYINREANKWIKSYKPLAGKEVKTEEIKEVGLEPTLVVSHIAYGKNTVWSMFGYNSESRIYNYEQEYGHKSKKRQ